MPRNRMIKHDFWADEKIGLLDSESKLLFIGMWNFADDIGVLRANYAYLKANIYPYDDKISVKNIKKMVSILTENGFLRYAEFNGEHYFLVKNFLKHQQINRPSKFRYIPDSDKHNILELFDSLSVANTLTADSLTKVKEKVKEKEKVKSCKSDKSDDVGLIVNYLNKKINSSYKPNSKATSKYINARLKEGFTAEDFKKVIDKKYNDWHKDDKMCKYLRPMTLFNSEKFESYLNEAKSERVDFMDLFEPNEIHLTVDEMFKRK